jgi:ATP-dependent 26S proteasome regulatory subunit
LLIAAQPVLIFIFFFFIVCREHAPSIIFMDEVDSIGSARTENSGGGGDSEVQRTMLELLNQLDGFEASNKIKVRTAWALKHLILAHGNTCAGSGHAGLS